MSPLAHRPTHGRDLLSAAALVVLFTAPGMACGDGDAGDTSSTGSGGGDTGSVTSAETTGTTSGSASGSGGDASTGSSTSASASTGSGGCGPGTHACGDVCADDDDPGACGASCEVCPAVDGGAAVCELGVCGAACGPGSSSCDGGCCPWSEPETIAPGRKWSVALALTPGGEVHVAYVRSIASGLSLTTMVEHAVRGDAGWSLSTIAAASYTDQTNPKPSVTGAALTIDGDGAPLAGYIRTQEWTTGSRDIAVRVVSKASGEWGESVAVDTFNSTIDEGLYEPLTLRTAPGGNVHLTYAECCTNNFYRDVRLATRSGDTWTVTELSLSADGVAHAIDERGFPAVVGLYQGQSLGFASWTGSEWAEEEVSTDVAQQPYSSVRGATVAVDAAGVRHVCWQTEDARLAYGRQDGAGASWEVEIADETVGGGEFCSIAVDGAGRPTICHHDAIAVDLRCTTRIGDAWSSAAIVSEGDVGAGIDLAFDADDRAHVVYFDATQELWRYIR